MRRARSHGVLTPAAVRRANSTTRAIDYYKSAEAPVEATAPVVMGTLVPDDPLPDSPLKVGMAVEVTKAGEWLNQLARVKAVHIDGTYDVSVFHNFATDTGSLTEELVLTNKPYPDEVRPAPPAAAARLEALANKPPSMWEPYKMRVVRECDGREEWGEVQINAPGFHWEPIGFRRERRGMELILLDSTSRSLWRANPGANERNTEKLLHQIGSANRWPWREVEDCQIYCNGRRLTEHHFISIHSAFEAGLPLVLVGKGQTYDQERWAPIAERPPSGACCVIS
jgi:hypothetical protein